MPIQRERDVVLRSGEAEDCGRAPDRHLTRHSLFVSVGTASPGARMSRAMSGLAASRIVARAITGRAGIDELHAASFEGSSGEYD
jgi:hypothetical protein